MTQNDYLPEVQLFRTRWVDGKWWGRDFLDQVVANYHRLAAMGNESGVAILPDSAIGHNPEQAMTKALLGRDDYPSWGWVKNLKREGDFIIGDIDDVPPEIAEQIRQKRYRYCSAEIFRDATLASGQKLGPTLQRVAFLGVHPPRCKGLGPLPMPVRQQKALCFAEPIRGQGTLYFFSEVFMNREEMLAQMMSMGITVSPESTISDEVLASMLACYHNAMSAAVTSPVDPEPEPVSPANTTATPEMFAEMVRVSVASAIAPIQTTLSGVQTAVAALQAKPAPTPERFGERMDQPLTTSPESDKARGERMVEAQRRKGELPPAK